MPLKSEGFPPQEQVAQIHLNHVEPDLDDTPVLLRKLVDTQSHFRMISLIPYYLLFYN